MIGASQFVQKPLEPEIETAKFRISVDNCLLSFILQSGQNTEVAMSKLSLWVAFSVGWVSVSPLLAQAPSWRRVDVGSGSNNMQAIYAVDTLHIWASNQFGRLFYTNDGGSNWSNISLDTCCPPLMAGNAFSFHFFDTSNGWVAGHAYNFPPAAQSFRLHTSDGGLSWTTQLDTGSLYGNQVVFLSQKSGFDLIGNACNFKDSFLVTSDSGKTWSRRATNIPACNLERLFFVDSLNGWGISAHPAPNNTGVDLIRTDDGGTTWSKVQSSIPICSGAKIFFQDMLNGWMWHCNPIIPNVYRFSRTSDGGITWDSLAGFGQSYWFNAFDASDANHFWLGGFNNFNVSIQSSVDGGRTWIEELPGVSDEIVNLDVLDCKHAYASAVSGYLYFYVPDSTSQAGDLNNDNSLSAADVVLMLNYVFLTVPTCTTISDIDFNDDCRATPSDVVLLLNRVFIGYPELQRGCT